MNDIIRITENKIAFLTTLNNQETLYIIIFHLYGDRKVKIRYFSIKLYALYHYKILFDLKLIKYKSNLGVSMSFCPNRNCSSDNDEHYSGLILFSYPNSTDTEFYLDKYIFDNNINFNEIEIDLEKQLNIENNLFGYIFSNIVINNIVNCGDYKLYLSENETIEIIDYSYLEKDDKIKIKYTGFQNIYPILNCNIEYFFNVKEPELEIYNNYTEDHEGENEDDLFNRQDYPGRLSYYYIKLVKELTTSCDNNNCDLCLNEQISYCLTCKYNFDLNNETGEIRKTCYDKLPETTDSDSNNYNNSNDNNNNDSYSNDNNNSDDSYSNDNNNSNDSNNNGNNNNDSNNNGNNSNDNNSNDNNSNDNNSNDNSNDYNSNDNSKIFCENEEIIKNKCFEGIISENQFEDLP